MLDALGTDRDLAQSSTTTQHRFSPTSVLTREDHIEPHCETQPETAIAANELATYTSEISNMDDVNQYPQDSTELSRGDTLPYLGEESTMPMASLDFMDGFPFTREFSSSWRNDFSNSLDDFYAVNPGTCQ